MQGLLLVAGVTVEVDGVLERCQNITVVDDGVIRMKEMYDTEGKPTKVCIQCPRQFTFICGEEGFFNTLVN